MDFYNREKETDLLTRIRERAKRSAQMTFVVGRRRIGKTTLLKKVYSESLTLYFFVAKKNEALLCEEFIAEIKSKLDVQIFGSMKSFKDIFGYLMELSQKRHFTLIIDEFQEFYHVNPSVYSDMQNSWDAQKNNSKINLVLCGSVYSLMSRIFEQSKEPLFGRATQRLQLKEFDVSTLKSILLEHRPKYTPDDLLAFYTITGGVAKYVELLVEARAFTLRSMVNEIFSQNSLFLDEGKNVLIDEFGKDYGNYFSILSLIASSKTSRVEIESILEMQTGGFLDRLESDFGIIKKVKPFMAKPLSRSIKYQINDNFLNFWFRFIYKYRSTIEIGNLDYMKSIVLRDYNTYSGKMLEKYFLQKISIEGNFSDIGTYWEKGNKNEIDIVAINDKQKLVKFYEVKRNASNGSVEQLKHKAKSIMPSLKGYKDQYGILSLDQM